MPKTIKNDYGITEISRGTYQLSRNGFGVTCAIIPFKTRVLKPADPGYFADGTPYQNTVQEATPCTSNCVFFTLKADKGKNHWVCQKAKAEKVLNEDMIHLIPSPEQATTQPPTT